MSKHLKNPPAWSKHEKNPTKEGDQGVSVETRKTHLWLAGPNAKKKNLQLAFEREGGGGGGTGSHNEERNHL